MFINQHVSFSQEGGEERLHLEAFIVIPEWRESLWVNSF